MTFWVAGAAVVGAVGGALISSDGARSASNTQADATNAGISENRRQYDQTRADYAPYLATGTRALGQLETDINAPTTAADVMSDPGYQFGLDQGRRAIDQKIAASGGRVSGASIKAAARFGTDYGATGYGAAYQRKQDRLNRLAALAGIGQTASAGSAAAGSNSTNAITSLLTSQGDARGASQVANGSIWSNATKQLAALGGRYFGGNTSNPYLGQGTNFYGGSGTTLYGDGYGPG